MTTQKQGNHESTKKPRDPDFVGAEAAMRRAAELARRRAIETSGSVAVFKDGKIVRDKAPSGLPDTLQQKIAELTEEANNARIGS